MAETHGDAKGVTAHTEADAGKKPFPPFEKSTFASQLVSLLIAFVALYLIVSRIALPRVGGVIDARQNAIDGDLAEAQKLKDASDGELKAYESELAAARSRARRSIPETVPPPSVRRGRSASGRSPLAAIHRGKRPPGF